MGVPVFLMGYAYPFIAALVLRRENTLGRHRRVDGLQHSG